MQAEIVLEIWIGLGLLMLIQLAWFIGNLIINIQHGKELKKLYEEPLDL